MVQKLCSSFFCLLLIYSFGLSYAVAQESVPIMTKELVKRSQKIVIGQVIEQHSAWDDLGREIYTYTMLRVDRVVKSEAPDAVLMLRHLGGKVGNTTSQVAGLPKFEQGERVLVFLGPYRGTNYYGLIDWHQGKYGVKKNKKAEDVLVGTGPGAGQSVETFVNELRRFQ